MAEYKWMVRYRDGAAAIVSIRAASQSVEGMAIVKPVANRDPADVRLAGRILNQINGSFNATGLVVQADSITPEDMAFVFQGFAVTKNSPYMIVQTSGPTVKSPGNTPSDPVP